VSTNVEVDLEITSARVLEPIGDVDPSGRVLGVEPELAGRAGDAAFERRALDKLGGDAKPASVAVGLRPPVTGSGTFRWSGEVDRTPLTVIEGVRVAVEVLHEESFAGVRLGLDDWLGGCDVHVGDRPRALVADRTK
jgi:hypothetical protein